MKTGGRLVKHARSRKLLILARSTLPACTGGGHVQGSARKDVVFGAARMYTFTVPGPKWEFWLKFVKEDSLSLVELAQDITD